MRQFSLIRKIVLLAGDLVIMTAGLFLALWIRNGQYDFDKFFLHLDIFGYLFIIWAIIFYLSDLYRPEKIIKSNFLLISLTRAMAIAIVTSIFFFYLVPSWRITPKTILLIFALATFLMTFIWRIIFIKISQADKLKNRVLLVGTSQSTKELAQEIEKNQQWGYQLVGFLPLEEKDLFNKPGELLTFLKKEKVNLIAAPFEQIPKKSLLLKELATAVEIGVDVINIPIFYEKLTGKVSIEQLDQLWFLYNLEESEKKLYELTKRLIDLILSLIGIAVFLLTIPLIWVLEKILNDQGGLFYWQKRVGLFGREFTLYKYRTMKADVDRNQVSWTKKHDPRLTKLGKVLRQLRIDELPQMINILKGDMSWIGPRPERPEFTQDLQKEIPFYNRRHIVRPGLTGWAQIEYRYGASVEDAWEKLQYDLYYIKNRSWFLDLTILLRTITIILGFKGR